MRKWLLVVVGVVGLSSLHAENRNNIGSSQVVPIGQVPVSAGYGTNTRWSRSPEVPHAVYPGAGIGGGQNEWRPVEPTQEPASESDSSELVTRLIRKINACSVDRQLPEGLSPERKSSSW